MSKSSYFGRSPELWQELVTETTEILQDVARQGATITYTELNSSLAERVDDHTFDFGSGAERAALGHLLGEVSLFSYQSDSVLLSALVVGSDKARFEPSGGFYALAQENGWLSRTASRDERVVFWHGHLEAAYKRFRRRRRVQR